MELDHAEAFAGEEIGSCQETVTVDPASGQGAPNVEGCFTAPDMPVPGVEPNLKLLGEPVAMYD